MSNTEIEAQTEALTRLKYSVFENIEEIRSLSAEDDESTSIESKKETLTKQAHSSISQMSDLLSVLELLILQCAPRSAEENLLWEKLSIHKLTVQHLKDKLKDSQIAAYEQQSKQVHAQILEEYVNKWRAEEGDTRDQLFAGRSAQPTGEKEKPIEEQVLNKNESITNNLKLTHQLMQMSVAQTELNIDTIGQQTKDLSTLNDKLVDLESLLNKSRQIVKFIEKQDKHDKRRIYLSIGFLLTCFAWVIWHRILKLPTKILLWTLLRAFGVVTWATSKMNASDTADSLSQSSGIAISSASHQALSISSFISTVSSATETSTRSEALSIIEEITSSIIEDIESASRQTERFSTEELSETSCGISEPRSEIDSEVKSVTTKEQYTTTPSTMIETRALQTNSSNHKSGDIELRDVSETTVKMSALEDNSVTTVDTSSTFTFRESDLRDLGIKKWNNEENFHDEL
ncbi:hypothetical_protein [Candidozyma auris]|uniref:hypothetical_protein n=1 Tax=Candidozyma auris TaxID=498019 RepID=UPI000D27E96B|nr:hypothetical_protein [[Candida] auris]QEO19327.1 hypothetical_protein [[Candida] auris]GBL50690.1 hypothetical protein CAJCM15448_29640 [[Candida] auris]